MNAEVAMIVTLKRMGLVWVVGCLDGTTRPFGTFPDALAFAAQEFEHALFDVVGWGSEGADA